MKTTMDIADDLLLRTKKMAKQQGVTVRSLVEKGLVLALKQSDSKKAVIKPVTFRGKGRQKTLETASWETLRDVIYDLKQG